MYASNSLSNLVARPYVKVDLIVSRYGFAGHTCLEILEMILSRNYGPDEMVSYEVF